MRKEAAHNSPAIWVLWIVRIWFPEKSSKYYTLYKLYTFVYFFMYIIHVATMVVHVSTIYQDIGALSATFYVLSIKLIGVYKVIYILKGMIFSQELLNVLEEKIFLPKDKRQENLEKSLFYGWKIRASIIIIGVAITVLFLNVWPVIDGLSNKRLPFTSWYPFDYQEFPLFGVIFLFQAMGTIYAGCINVGTDTFASQIMANIQIQCYILSDTLKHLFEYSKINLQSKNVPRQVIYENMNKMLIECVQHHRAILRYSKDAEKLFNLGVVGLFAISCLVMCLNMLRMTWARASLTVRRDALRRRANILGASRGDRQTFASICYSIG
ncbi:hypothetical protein WA026_005205 [Henosepilachna vigintioctopunctata]|uniref:Odorant receptor n=1 Tax=Henosepilachna vigintioctopunctata TaxID=420089 RepID=A0AAW1UWD7_9CUCU